jgi:hypothetical protein
MQDIGGKDWKTNAKRKQFPFIAANTLRRIEPANPLPRTEQQSSWVT